METHNVIESDIAFRNLQVTAGLPDAEELDVPRLLQQLDGWVRLVEQTTERYAPQFRSKPEQFGNSWAQFRALCMVTVLQRDLGVHYDPDSMQGDFDASDSRRLFIHGPLLGQGGTCVNLPVLYVAVGQWLGYPLKLVEAKEHLFVRWVGDDGERFNVEATSQGYVSHPDAHYQEWPKPLSSVELASGQYLTELSPEREQACFWAERGRCLMDNLDLAGAIGALTRACEIDPTQRGKLLVAESMVRVLEQLSVDELLQPPQWQTRIQHATPAPQNDWEAWAIPIAQQDLLRIFQLAHKQNRLHWKLPSQISTGTSDIRLVTEIFA